MNKNDIIKNLESARTRHDAFAITDLFEQDPVRFSSFHISFDDCLFDFSKHLIDRKAFDLLLKLIEASGLRKRRTQMFSGDKINSTENRAVLHTALRSQSPTELIVDDQAIDKQIISEKHRCDVFARAVRNGQISGKGGAFTDVVNIGIGGSDLGPAMAYKALSPYRTGPRCHFVSNVDGADITDVLAGLDPSTTLFLVASKTFTTQETMTNANTARAWIADALGEQAVLDHFAALSSSLNETRAFGIREEYTFGFWDWVGGRYSIWSSIGMSLMIAVGAERFDEFLKGAADVDEHFKNAPLEQNIPVVMAALGIWYRNFFDLQTHAVLPYDNRLSRFPAYLQQLDMESNGKRVSLDGDAVQADTGPIVWGEPGTNGQHAFYQLIHQGTTVIPCDFLVARQPHEDDLIDHHQKLVANCFAQSEALMIGKSRQQVVDELFSSGMAMDEIERLAPHKMFPGNRPSSTFLYDKLTPNMLGRLIALYEHKVFVQGVVWNINSYDQWGVELGKQLANSLLPFVTGDRDLETISRDQSTKALVASFLSSHEKVN